MLTRHAAGALVLITAAGVAFTNSDSIAQDITQVRNIGARDNAHDSGVPAGRLIRSAYVETAPHLARRSTGFHAACGAETVTCHGLACTVTADEC